MDVYYSDSIPISEIVDDAPHLAAGQEPAFKRARTDEEEPRPSVPPEEAVLQGYAQEPQAEPYHGALSQHYAHEQPYYEQEPPQQQYEPEPQPAYHDALPPVQEAPPPQYEAPPPQYEAPPPQYAVPPPQYEAPPPQYEAPPPQYEAPPPQYEAPPPQYEAPPPPQYEAPPPPQYEAAAPGGPTMTLATDLAPTTSAVVPPERKPEACVVCPLWPKGGNITCTNPSTNPAGLRDKKVILDAVEYTLCRSHANKLRYKLRAEDGEEEAARCSPPPLR